MTHAAGAPAFLKEMNMSIALSIIGIILGFLGFIDQIPA